MSAARQAPAGDGWLTSRADAGEPENTRHSNPPLAPQHGFSVKEWSACKQKEKPAAFLLHSLSQQCTFVHWRNNEEVKTVRFSGPK